MAAIDDLIAQVENAGLRERLKQEAARLASWKKFGLVFERHIPEYVPLYELPITQGCSVALKTGNINDIYQVMAVNDETVLCRRGADQSHAEFNIKDLIRVAKFGEAIYPALEPVDVIRNAPDSDLWHILIQADNYHALQLLNYLYSGKVDCIYIDPPYNTGARDWKYNNNYVDSADSYRHSKWLSMMEKRLKLAKKLLNPDDSVMIIAIDEKEYLHLGCLLEDLFPEARMQMVSTMINPANVARAGEFGRSGEYIFFVMFGNSAPQRVRLEREWVSSRGRTHTGNIRWDLLKRSGTNSERRHSPGGFYPIYINKATGKIEKIGDPLPEGISEAPGIDGCHTLLPIRQNRTEGNWQWSGKTFLERMQQGRVKIGGNREKGFTVYILKDGEYGKIKRGEFVITGRGINNEIIVADNDTEHVLATPGDIWKISSHDATQYGSRLIGNIFLSRRFSFPKSLYAVHDAIRFFVANKPNALILDFFAGSGTTLHAVNLLNAGDGGRRRCVMVTNNEVSAEEAGALTAQGHRPGDEEWEKIGIARHVAWPRTVCSILGRDINGEPLKGSYLGCDLPMAAGFKANAAFFRLRFLDKTNIQLGARFKEILPLLWLKAGPRGERPILESESLPDMLILPENRFAVLLNEDLFFQFAARVNQQSQIDTIFIITDYEENYRDMLRHLAAKNVFQLYRDYLENFRINQERNEA